MTQAQVASVPSSTGPASKKEKKSKKRKLEEALDESAANTGELESPLPAEKKKSSKRKKSNAAPQAKDTATAEVKENSLSSTSEPGSSKPKKSKRDKRKAESAQVSGIVAGEIDEDNAENAKKRDEISTDNGQRNSAAIRLKEDTAMTNFAQQEDAQDVDEEVQEHPQDHHQRHKPRFIAFIGQLPYTATVESIAKHFEKISPSSIRLPTNKSDATKNKGYAFLEFEAYDRMKTCLKLYHRTTFDDGISPPRKLKVELTAGGGGSNPQRKEKIKYKNEKLGEERRRRAKAEAEQNFKKETKQKFAAAKGRRQKQPGQRRAPRVDQQLQENVAAKGTPIAAGDHGGMHPDRLARINM